MPKFTFIYRELFRLLNALDFRSSVDPSAPASTPIEKAKSFNPIKPLSVDLPSRFTEAVMLRHPRSRASASALFCPQALNRKSSEDTTNQLNRYLHLQENLPEDIVKLHQIIAMQRVILEIGCGNCQTARRIALKNPDWGIIATDKYAWGSSTSECSHYQKVAQEWKISRQKTQATIPPNLVIVRAESDILHFLPNQSIDSLLLVNPEPLVGQAFLGFVALPIVFDKIKPGNRQIVIVPFSREMGIVACGGYEFDHSQDWSKGLGFLMDSAFRFQTSGKVQWGVDLRGSSPYSKNSTQTDVYIYGNKP
jgi:hypothetical protein